jgi:hypothetical protein
MIKSKIRILRKKGYSYAEISKKVNKSKKFVWTIAKNIKFSKKGKVRYHKKVKGILVVIKPWRKIMTILKVRLIGHLLFDGTVYKLDYVCVARYINSSRELINQFIRDMKEVYGLNPIYFEEFSFYYKVTFKSKLLYEDLMNYFKSYSTSNPDIKIPKMIMNSSKKIKIEFLKTFWEDEGSISAVGRLMADSKSYSIIQQLGKLLKEFNFKFGICRYKEPTGYMYKIYLFKTKENLNLFLKLGLFEKAIITHGKNKGKKKLEILKETIRKF